MTSVESMQKNLESMLDSTIFGEDIIYTDANGSQKNIRAFVYRKKARASGQRNDRSANNSQMTYDIEIQISNSSSKGIATVTEKKDTVTLAVKLSGTATTMRVMAILDQDPAAWTLGLSA